MSVLEVKSRYPGGSEELAWYVCVGMCELKSEAPGRPVSRLVAEKGEEDVARMPALEAAKSLDGDPTLLGEKLSPVCADID